MKKNITFILVICMIFAGIAIYLSFGDVDTSESVGSNSSVIEEEEVIYESEDSANSWNSLTTAIIILVPVSIMFFAFKDLFKHFLGGGERTRILKNGRAAKAKIVKLGESGRGVVTVNDQPFVSIKLEVYDGNKPPYQVEIKTVIARLDVPKFQPGTELAIKIDPNNPEKIAIDPKGEYFQNNVPLIGKKYSEEDREIMKNKGIKAKAKIISVEDTGESKDFNPIIKMVYEVHMEGKNPYVLNKKISSPTEKIKIIQSFLGKTIPAKVHPSDNNKVELTFIPQ